MPSLSEEPSLSIVVADVGVAFGGAIVSGATLCGGLAALGHRVLLVTAMAEADVRHVVPSSVEVRTLRQTVDYRRWEELTKARQQARSRRLGKLLQYPEVLTQLVLRNLPYSMRLAGICREFGADILHANNGPDLPTSIAARLARRPLAMHLRGVHTRSRIVDLAVGSADLFIAISQYTLDNCILAGVPREKALMLLNPVEQAVPSTTEVARVRQELGAETGQFLIGSVGRIVPWKGQLELIQALTPFLQETPDARVAFVGDAADADGQYLAAVRNWVADGGLSHQVCFAGFRPDVHAVYAALDVMAHTATSPEPFGRVIVEAMLQRCAVVASPMGGPLEIISDGIDGVLLDPRDSEALRDGIRRLYTDGDRRLRIAEAGERMARRRFGAAAYAERMVSAYQVIRRDASPHKRPIARYEAGNAPR